MTDDDGPGWEMAQMEQERQEQEAADALKSYELSGAQHDSNSGSTKKDGASALARAFPGASDQPFTEAAEEGRP